MHRQKAGLYFLKYDLTKLHINNKMQKTEKQSKLILGLALILTTSLFSCSQDADLEGQSEIGQGQLMLSLDSNTDFIDATRAVVESNYENVDNYTVVVVDKSGNEKLNCKGSEIKSKMPLTMGIGGFTVKAFYGKEEAASRDNFYVLGEYSGTIKAEQKENITVTCTPTCGRITVNFGEDMATYFADFNVTFTGTEALGSKTIAWLKDDTEPWYVKLKENSSENINFTITTNTKDEYISGDKEQVTTKSGSFSLSRNKAYKMNINPSYNPSTSGEISIEVTIDESTNDIPVDIEVPVTWL